MPIWTRTARRSVLMATAGLGLGLSAAQASPMYTLLTTIPVPPSADNNVGGKFATYDISDIDPVTHLLYVADRSNASVDVFSTQTLSFVTRIGGSGHLFSGQVGSNNGISGPDGVVVARSPTVSQVFAGNGDSTLKSFALSNYAQQPTVSTGGTTRVDELAFDPTRNVVIAVNNAEAPPFVSLVDATTHSIIAKITFNGLNNTPDATAGGLEAPAWDPVTGKYYVSVPQIGTSGPGGVAEIDPVTHAVTRTFDFAALGLSGACSPSGLVAGAAGKLLVGCGASGGNSTVVLDPTAGTIHVVHGIGGEDQVWYDAASGLYFTASRLDASGPVLGIIDANTDLLLQKVPTTPADHSVAVDPLTGDAFVPLGGVAGNTVCPNGCIGVYARAVPEPSSLPLLATAVLGFAGLLGWRMRGE